MQSFVSVTPYELNYSIKLYPSSYERSSIFHSLHGYVYIPIKLAESYNHICLSA